MKFYIPTFPETAKMVAKEVEKDEAFSLPTSHGFAIADLEVIETKYDKGLPEDAKYAYCDPEEGPVYFYTNELL